MKYKSGAIVEIFNTTDPQIDGQTCRVIGRAADFAEATFYIVQLGHPVVSPDGFVNEAIQIIEHCLR